MDRTVFESRARDQGYQEPLEREMAANVVNPTHAHEFDAQLLILGGEMTILRGVVAHTYRQGDTARCRPGPCMRNGSGRRGCAIWRLAGIRGPPTDRRIAHGKA